MDKIFELREGQDMLVIAGTIKVLIAEVRGCDRVRIGIEAPREISILREELVGRADAARKETVDASAE